MTNVVAPTCVLKLAGPESSLLPEPKKIKPKRSFVVVVVVVEFKV
jgi:hypothetical protein